jgi:hypothetical protein
MSGTPGDASLSSVIDRLFNMPNHANVADCSRRSSRKGLAAPVCNRSPTKPVNAASYGSLTASQLVRNFASRAAFTMYCRMRSR